MRREALTPLLRAFAKRTGLGQKRERRYFDDAYYCSTYADIAAAGVDPFDHFMQYGWREGRNPSATFSTLFYRDDHLDGAEVNPLQHYAEAGRRSRLATQPASPDAFLAVQRTVVRDGFDFAYYARQTGPLTQDPILHYLATGWRLGHSPSPAFDPTTYVAEHAFIRALGISPFYHFASQGRMRSTKTRERREDLPRLPPEDARTLIAGAFDRNYYLSQYGDVAQSGSDPLEHFVGAGWRERRNPTPLFDTAYYLASNRDVAASGINPFLHYLETGRRQGRRPNPAGTRLYPPLRAPNSDAWHACHPAADTAGADYVVIMPVYRGYDETLAAIHAVLVASQTTRFALHVIDDKSPDPKLAGTLADLAGRGLFSYEINATNLGFVKSCNRGLRAFADKEVVLLNADATVSGDWLDRIDAHARRDPRIATITPLSNNATICSYPVVNANNLIETECPADRLDALAAVCNAGRVSDIPTGVGFCFYMSRESRAAIGVLDDIAFGRGYGEENDFCLRAAKAGFRNVLAEDIFVYHAGEVSFAELAATEYGQAQAALIGKHPDYPGRVKQHLRNDPGTYGRMRLDLKRLACFAHGRSMVFVSHALSGGIVTHIEHMERRLAEDGVAVVHLRVGVTDRWSVEISCGADDAPFCPNLRPTSFLQLRPLIAEFLDWLAPMAIHVHSLVGFDWGATTSLLDLVKTSGRSYYFTLHDYSVVCHRNDLVLTNGRYCGLPDVETCRTCVAGDRSYPEALDPLVRRRTFASFLEGARSVFAPSQDVATRLRGVGASYEIVVRPHEETRCHVSERIGSRSSPRAATYDEPLVVAVVGAIGAHKGSQILLDLARDAKARDLPLRYHIIGHSDLTDEMIAAGVTESGRYADEDEAAALIADLRPDCIFLPSIWPETFCYALSLAFRLGIPPVVFDLGAQRDRVATTGFGFILPYDLMNHIQDLNRAISELPYDEAARAELTQSATYPSIRADYYELSSDDGGGRPETNV